MSSPVLATTDSSSPTTSSMPRASLAPPVPPASTTTVTSGRRPALRRQARHADSGVALVPGVDREQQRGQRLGDACHLQPSAIDAAQARDALEQSGHRVLVAGVVAAHQDVLIEAVLEVAER